MGSDFSQFKPRLDRAVREGERLTIGVGSSPQDIATAFRTHNLLEPRQTSVAVEPEVVRVTDAELRQWYVIKTAPRRESDVDGGLGSLGIDAYCPKMRFFRPARRLQKGRPKKEAVEAPLFVGYVFAGFALAAERHWLKVRGIDGIHSVLGHHGAPQPISRWIVDQLKADERAGAFDSTVEKPKPRPGQPLIVRAGPFAGTFANVERLATGDRLKVLMKCLGGMVSVQLGLDDVEIMA